MKSLKFFALAFLLYLKLKVIDSFLRSEVKLKVSNGYRYCRLFSSESRRNVPSTSSAEKKETVQRIAIQSIGAATILAKLLLDRSSIAKAEDVFASLPDLKRLDCQDGILLLQHPGIGRVVVMIGTAHISEESVNVVRRTVQNVHPDTVMIELDTKRIAKANVKEEELQTAGFILPKGASLSGDSDENGAFSVAQEKRVSFVDVIKQKLVAPIQSLAQSLAGAALGRAIGQFYKSVEKLGFNTGGEFIAAVEEGRKLNSKILLGDRDVDITLQRLATAVSKTNPDKLSETFDKFELIEKNLGLDPSALDNQVTKEQLGQFVESIKQKRFIVELMRILRSELPEIYSALVGERDRYMANAIINADESKLMVGVVGLAHLAGIESILTSEGGFRAIERNCPKFD